MSDEVADAIANGREYIEKNGWWRGGLVGPNGRQACALGGLLLGNGYEAKQSVFKDDPLLYQAIARLAGLVDPIWVDRHVASPAIYTNAVASWNDRDRLCKDKQAVLDVFAKAEKIERAGYDPDA
jgi:hypothetical protein